MSIDDKIGSENKEENPLEEFFSTNELYDQEEEEFIDIGDVQWNIKILNAKRETGRINLRDAYQNCPGDFRGLNYNGLPWATIDVYINEGDDSRISEVQVVNGKPKESFSKGEDVVKGRFKIAFDYDKTQKFRIVGFSFEKEVKDYTMVLTEQTIFKYNILFGFPHPTPDR